MIHASQAKKPRGNGPVLFSLPETKYTFIKTITADQLKDQRIETFEHPLVVLEWKPNLSEENMKLYKEDQKLFREDWEVSDMRVTHGRAQVQFEDPSLEHAMDCAFKEALPNGLLESVCPLDEAPALKAATRSCQFAMVTGQADVKFELFSHACFRWLEGGTREIVTARSQDISIFLQAELAKHGGAAGRHIRSAEQELFMQTASTEELSLFADQMHKLWRTSIKANDLLYLPSSMVVAGTCGLQQECYGMRFSCFPQSSLTAMNITHQQGLLTEATGARIDTRVFEDLI